MRHVLVIGAGPAGLSAAVAASDAGARVTLLDSGDALGGQYWRHLPPERPSRREARLHHGWKAYGRLRDRAIADTAIEVLTEAQVWAIETVEAVTAHVLIGPVDSAGREARTVTADATVLATGAHDRTLPFPGWHLPGVYSAGAAQALAKGERVSVGHRVVVAGAGPFLLPVAQSLTAAGARVLGVFEAARPAALARGWLPRPHRLLSAARKAPELAGYAAHHLRRRVPYRLGRAVIEARGEGRVEAVVTARLDADWRPLPGTERTLAADAVCVSHGFTPRLELPIAAGCRIGPDRFVAVDADQRTSVGCVYAAGESTGIGGVDAALVEGRIAGHRAAGGRSGLRGDLRRRAATTEFARRIEAAHGIRPGWTSWLTDDTVICRCEEVAYGPLRDAAAATAQTSTRSLKLTTRAGLGLCQARMCGRTLEDLTGAAPARAEDTTDRRPLAAPVRLGDLAALAPEETS